MAARLKREYAEGWQTVPMAARGVEEAQHLFLFAFKLCLYALEVETALIPMGGHRMHPARVDLAIPLLVLC